MAIIYKYADNLFRDFAKYVSLNVLGLLGISCYILADTFIIANGVGALGLTALNIAIPMYSFINGISLMLGIGAATSYSIYRAQNKKSEANKIFTNIFITGLIIGVGFSLLGIFQGGNLSQLLGADSEAYFMTKKYLRTIMVFSPLFILNSIMVAFVRNDNAPGLSMLSMVLGSLFNIVFDYIFVFPLDMGIFGAALATGLAPIIGLITLSFHFVMKRNNIKVVKCAYEIKGVIKSCKMGIAAFIGEISSGFVIIAYNNIILSIVGNIGVAAYGVIANIALVVLAIFSGITQGMQPLLSYNYGKGNINRSKRILKWGIYLSVILAIIIYIVSIINNAFIVEAFNIERNLKLNSIASRGIMIYFTGFLFAGLNIVIAAYLAATEKVKAAAWISISRGLIIIIPTLFILSYFFKMDGVWLSFLVTEILTGIIALRVLKTVHNKALSSKL